MQSPVPLAAEAYRTIETSRAGVVSPNFRGLSSETVHRLLRLEAPPVVDVEGQILEGIGVSSDALSISEAFARARTRHCYERHLKEMLERVGMHQFTLRFLPQFEGAFAYSLHRRAVRRIRYSLAIGFVSLLGKTLYMLVHMHTSPAQWWTLLVGACIALPTLVGAFLCTFREGWTSYCEVYTSVAFVVVCSDLTAQKLVLQSPGPVLELFVCFIPIFGITRLRFDVVWRVVTATIIAHLLALVIAQQENTPDIGFQGHGSDVVAGSVTASRRFSYLGGIVGGGVAHYRVEVLRRRNYMMHLPFCPGAFDPLMIFSTLKQPATSKHELLHPYTPSTFSHVFSFMHRVTLQFGHPEIESAFYRYWYLLDGSPFEPLETSRLHKKAFRAIRYAVQSVFFQQLLQAIQDRRYLTASGVPAWSYWTALTLRICVVLSYFGAQWCMHEYGHAYYESWEQLQSPAPAIAAPEASPALLEAVVPPRNYVKSMQRLSGFIAFGHALTMGLILVFCTVAEAKSVVAAPCYYLGLLNALLYPHRSGFRVRFIFASIATVAAGVVFIVVCIAVAPAHAVEYGSYIGVVLVLAMLISYEEESLRRAFFVCRALRTREFVAWHAAVQAIAPYVRRRLCRRRGLPLLQVASVPVAESTTEKAHKIPTCTLLAKASRCGMYSDICQAVVAAMILTSS
ncbi:hypothetical protein ACHHYP_04649 [Achlya hypogyna]|uniref:Transmembrane protein n=1 Tax=Achlya hypogyna TaxID=1202772 RepID=A0A1V9ZP17_ACHHY|nr:hypothetical protein ACHHYP_04649 [Achlya hypogyna]